jgi:hypothetical protein
MEQVTIACIVEGHGETRAVPELLRRLAHELSVWDLWLPPPQRVHRMQLIAPGRLENLVQAMALRVPGAGGVLILLDADDDCPATLGPALLARARAARPDKAVAVVLANREFEAWFLAAAPSIAGRRGLKQSLATPRDPEDIRDAKGWLSHHMTGAPYRAAVDQVALAARFDIKAARENSASFDKFCREVERLLSP